MNLTMPGALIRDWRKRLKMSQAGLATALGLGQQAISTWERLGEVQPAHWPALVEALKLSPSETAQLQQALLDQYAPASEAA
jgi:DNA-binding transcriptional regulator YiaG